MPDESTYGFSKPDAEDLLQLIGNVTRESRDGSPRGAEYVRYGRTAAAIASGASGSINFMHYFGAPTGWAVSTDTFTGEAHPVALPNAVPVACFYVNGVWWCHEICETVGGGGGGGGGPSAFSLFSGLGI